MAASSLSHTAPVLGDGGAIVNLYPHTGTNDYDDVDRDHVHDLDGDDDVDVGEAQV